MKLMCNLAKNLNPNKMKTTKQKIQVLKDYERYKETFSLEFVTNKLKDDISEIINRFSDKH